MEDDRVKKILTGLVITFLLAGIVVPLEADAAGKTYTIVFGDTLWKIAKKYEVGLAEIIHENGQIKNPDSVYPGMQIKIPDEQATQSFEQEVVKLVNQEREKNGLKPLKENWELSRIARYKSNDMKDKGYFSHTSPTYGSPFEMMKNFGIHYSYAGENIAMGQRTAQEVMKAWMNSSGHRANILNKNFTEIGVGYAVNGKGTAYWTQMFIKPQKTY
jgi:uncharacterized YkwD family protein/spore coat assembly protein SafA